MLVRRKKRKGGRPHMNEAGRTDFLRKGDDPVLRRGEYKKKDQRRSQAKTDCRGGISNLRRTDQFPTDEASSNIPRSGLRTWRGTVPGESGL